MAIKQFRARITTGATTEITAESCTIREITISPNAVGTAYTLQIQDKAGSPFILVPAFTLAVPANGMPTIMKWDHGVRMDGGIDIVTGGTPAGAVAVWITAEKGTKIPA
jgi:hypothetical protein